VSCFQNWRIFRQISFDQEKKEEEGDFDLFKGFFMEKRAQILFFPLLS
jgi:hypothetical protein